MPSNVTPFLSLQVTTRGIWATGSGSDDYRRQKQPEFGGGPGAASVMSEVGVGV
jgi:hypothetical protein